MSLARPRQQATASPDPGSGTRWTPLLRVLHTLALLLAAGWVLLAFVRPTGPHNGLNQYQPGRYLALVEGTAHRPFVYRPLLPTAVRLIGRATPEAVRRSTAQAVADNRLAAKGFAELGWETGAAWEYLVGCVLMWLCFAGFGHWTARLTRTALGIGDRPGAQLGLSVLALAGVLPLFTYNSFPYDPPQLFLFAWTLHALVSSGPRRLIAAFTLLCLNKETAILVIPIQLVARRQLDPRVAGAGTTALLAAIYVVVRSTIWFTYRDNPGSFVEFHLLDHNLRWLTHGWTIGEFLDGLLLVLLLAYRWREKARFLRVAFLCTLPPLALLAFFLGYLDEWRGYHEAYPAGFALVVDSVRRLRRDLPARPG